MYRSILRRFPRDIEYGFAYGSGVKNQLGYEGVPSTSKMIDFIFCVKDPHQWHHQNLERNESHYSMLRLFGSKFISNYQQSFGAKMYFNTLIPIQDEGVLIKYGVISTEHLIEDLLAWKYLYVSGRLHKPVDVVVPTNNEAIKHAVAQNMRSALRSALLILPNKFNDFELFYTISSLSYIGDFRMIFGENKEKVRNIVVPQLADFYKYYIPTLREFSDYVAVSSEKGKFFEQDKSPATTEIHLRNLPKYLLDRIIFNSGFTYDVAKNLHKLAARRDINVLALDSVKQIVRWSSISQSVKNIPSAGLGKSLVYSSKKVLKMFKV